MRRDPDPSEAGSLDRFVEAQDTVWDQVQAELNAGKKRSHWMWFVFPQLRSLGRSTMALHYGLADLAEARRYLAHPTLRERLVGCCEILIGLETNDPFELLGTPDDMKLQSSMTIFALAEPDEPGFRHVLSKFYSGEMDCRTEESNGGSRDRHKAV